MIETADRLDQVATYYFSKKLEEIGKLNAEGKDIINLGIGSPDLQPPKEVVGALIDGLQTDKAHQYQSYGGLMELKTGFAQFYQTHFGASLDPEKEILPLIGSKEGVMHIAMTFLNPGDEVLVPNPGYPAYKMTTLLAGGKPVFYDLKAEDHWLPDLGALAQMDLSKVKLMWLNYPNMPTGAKATLAFFKDLIAFCAKHQILLCHDNPYAFILNEEPISILSVEGAKDHALELTSLSKCFNMAGWRVGAVAGNAHYIKMILRFKSNMDSGMFKPIQLAAKRALMMDKDWFEGLNEEYRARREKARAIFDFLGATYETDAAGLFIWAKAPSKDAAYWSDRLLEKARVFITPGFIFGSNGADYLRISLCSPVEKMEEAFERIKEAI